MQNLHLALQCLHRFAHYLVHPCTSHLALLAGTELHIDVYIQLQFTENLLINGRRNTQLLRRDQFISY